MKRVLRRRGVQKFLAQCEWFKLTTNPKTDVYQMEQVFIEPYFQRSANVQPSHVVLLRKPREGFEELAAPVSRLKVRGSSFFMENVRGTVLKLSGGRWVFTTLIGTRI